MSAPAGQVRTAAARFLALNHLEPLDKPVAIAEQLDACAEHLEAVFGLDPDQACDQALQAWAELEGRIAGARFDLDASTPWLVWVDDPVTGRRRAVAVADLLRLMGPRGVRAAG